MPEQDWHERIVELARAQARAAARREVAEAMRRRMYEAYVQHYDAELAAIDTYLSDLEDALRRDAREYALSTGDFDLHESIQVKRKPVTWLYDAEQVLEEAKERGESRLVRVKEELNKVALNKLLAEGTLNWVQAEPVRDVVVVVGKLGEWVIREGKDENA
jgi:phage host-nuclease inhibitor protein Gam